MRRPVFGWALVLVGLHLADANRRRPTAPAPALIDVLPARPTPTGASAAASAAPPPTAAGDDAPPACADDALWTDGAGRGCVAYSAEGWCNASYFSPGHESLATTDPATNPGDACCACGRGRGGCLQARADQYCAEAGVGAVARKAGLFWNCYASTGADDATACVGVSGWYQRCRVGVGGAPFGGLHHERISAILREGCESKAEQARRKQAREQGRVWRDAALARGDAPGSCMQAAMDALCAAQFAPRAVSRRFNAQYLCCAETAAAAGAAGEQALGCIDENGFFTDCAPCDRSAAFRDFSEQLRAVQRHGCREPPEATASLGRGGGGRAYGLAREGAGPARLGAREADRRGGVALVGLALLALAAHAERRRRARRQRPCGDQAAAASETRPGPGGRRATSELL